MKRIKILLVICILVLLLPSAAIAATYNNSIPSGSIMVGWVVGNSGGQATISFSFSGNSGVTLPTSVPFDTSWHSLDDVRPILLAYQEGDGNYLGGSNGIFGSNINFSDNVLAAIKVQNFNPSQVGGANIPPSEITLNSEQIAWLEKVGYSVDSMEQVTPTPTPTPTPEPPSSAAPQAQTQTISSEQSTPQSSQSLSSTLTQQSKVEPSPSTVQSNPEVGETVKTEAGPMTEEMIAASQKMSAENPPDLNPANIPIATPSDSETEASSSWYQLSYQWLWVIGGVAILILAGVFGRIIYLKRRVA